MDQGGGRAEKHGKLITEEVGFVPGSNGGVSLVVRMAPDEGEVEYTLGSSEASRHWAVAARANDSRVGRYDLHVVVKNMYL